MPVGGFIRAASNLLLAAFLFVARGCLILTPATAQTTKPDCVFDISFRLAGQTAPSGSGAWSNTAQACENWTVVYISNGFSAVSVEFDAAPDSGGVPGTWAAWSGKITAGTNPATSTTFASVHATGFAPWVRVKLTSVTGAGSISGRVYGYKNNPAQFSNATGAGGLYNFTPVVPGDWVTVQPSTSFVRTDSSFIQMTQLGNGPDHPQGGFPTNNLPFSMVCHAVPAVPYKAKITYSVPPYTNIADTAFYASVGWRNSATKEEMDSYFGAGNVAGGIFRTTGTTVDIYGGASPENVSAVNYGLASYILTDNGTNRAFLVWDGYSIGYGQRNSAPNRFPITSGQYWTTQPDQICMGINVYNNNYTGFVNLLGFDVF